MPSSTKAKTQPTRRSVPEFITHLQSPSQRTDAQRLVSLMKRITGEKPVLWGSNMVGFGTYHYRYESGREGDSFIVGFSPRKQNLTIYIMPGYSLLSYQKLLSELGPHSLGKSCLYLKRLDDVRLPILTTLIKKGYTDMKKKYPAS